MENMELYNKVKVVPDVAKKQIKGGRLSGMTDINPMWRIKVLTEQFGVCGFGWYYKVTNKWLESRDQEVAAFVDIELYVKIDGEWSAPICGTGGSKFVTQEKGGAYMSDECYKMATTDAISVACKSLGIGADVYFEKDRTKYDQASESQKAPAQKKAPEQTSDNTKHTIIDLAEEYAQMNNGVTGEQVLKTIKTKIPFELDSIDPATAQKVVAQLQVWITKTKQKRETE